MATSNSAATRSTHNRRTAQTEPVEQAKEMTHDIVEYVTDYARENPGSAALCCLGIGFVLGWKLKPW